MGFHVISRLWNDAVLRYLTTQLPCGGRGRPKQHDGKIDIENLDEGRFKVINLDTEQGCILPAVVNSVSLKRNIRLCIRESATGKIHKLYFSTIIQMAAKGIINYYRARFQIEFYYRDGKLTDCQSRNLNKLHFHTSLTSINLTKVKAKEKKGPCDQCHQ